MRLSFDPKPLPAQPLFVKWRDAAPMFTPEECARIVAIGLSQTARKGTVGNDRDGHFAVDEAYRRVSVAQIEPDDSTRWIYLRIAMCVDRANREQYRFDIAGLVEPLQFLSYQVGGHYRWHQDMGGELCSTRKLSLSVQLSASESYDGGDLVLFGAGEVPMTDCRAQGDAVLFASHAPHKVEPVTRGIRYALVAWIAGPQFR